ncbi:DUF1801 domain-containing protein [Leucobacter tenebrionis]|uniref:DUF1801 domain-containing protein n=1 Tax=Leucobacter tenebrionis TaxID=2873270 RepID=UPI001CA72E06|nr:DUF1801 domain-containing protein [Leucobacter tenebrionis]QZY51526.1 DUF1801 domain-containing protein [Leucobacter tenebrionis]
MPSSTQQAVEAWLREMSDDRVPLLAELCRIIEQSDGRVVGEIKWNAPSYRIVEHFATTGIERKGGIRLVLHTGAAKRETPLPMREHVEDPTGLLTWKGSDRAVALFSSIEDVCAAREALTAILRQWIAAMPFPDPEAESETSSPAGSETAETDGFPSSLGKVALRALSAEGITRFEQLAERTKKELLALHGVGPKAIRILGEELEARGLSFRGE